MNAVRRFFISMKSLLPALASVALVALAISYPGVVLATGEDDDVLPYQKGINVFYESMTGPVPFIISLMGIVGCGAMLIFGGEISGFMRTMIFIVLVVSVIVQAKSLIKLLGLDWAPAALLVSPILGTFS